MQTVDTDDIRSLAHLVLASHASLDAEASLARLALRLCDVVDAIPAAEG